MSGIKGIPGSELVYAAATFAVAIAQEFDPVEINILSSFFSAVGDGLAIIAAQQAAAQSASEKNSENARPPQCDYIPERESYFPEASIENSH